MDNKVKKNNVRKALFLSFLGKIPALIRYGDNIRDTRSSVLVCERKKKKTSNVLQRPEWESDRLNNSAEIGT